MDKRIVGVYDNGHDAVKAIEDLKRQGYDRDDISVVAKDRNDVDLISEETGTKTEEGMAAGAATGGVLGGLAGLLAGVGALAIPGIGPILAAGPIAATLTGAAVGAGAGGLAGALIGMGIPEDEADRYESDVKSGKILVLVDPNGKRSYTDETTATTAGGLGAGSVGTFSDTDETLRGTTLDNHVSGTNIRNERTDSNLSSRVMGDPTMGGLGVSDSSTLNRSSRELNSTYDDTTVGGSDADMGDSSFSNNEAGYNPGFGTDPSLSNTPPANAELGDSSITNNPFDGTNDTLSDTTRNRDRLGGSYDNKN